jgi:hypothetical protein
VKKLNVIQKAIRRYKYRSKEHVTPDDFIMFIEEVEYETNLDPEALLFFRHHPATVNLIHRIEFNNLRATDEKTRNLVMSAFMADMLDYTLGLGWRPIDESAPFSDILSMFSKTYRDAGRLIGHAALVFLGLGHELYKKDAT